MNIDLKTTMNGFFQDPEENFIDFVNLNRILSQPKSEEDILECFGKEGK